MKNFRHIFTFPGDLSHEKGDNMKKFNFFGKFSTSPGIYLMKGEKDERID